MTQTTREPMKPMENHASKKALLVSDFFGSKHPLFGTFGITLREVGEAHAVIYMPYSARLADARGALHRGAMVTLLDTACGVAIFTKLGSMQPIATVDLRIDYLRTIPLGIGLRATVTCTDTTESMAFIQGQAVTEDESEPLALVNGSFAIGTLGPSFDSSGRSAE